MVCSADDLLGWKDFPKGLRVLLLDNDEISTTETKSNLEEMDYVVSRFCDENEALAAISSKSETFDVAIVEVSTSNGHGSFRFLENARDLPTIMVSNIHCLSTTMKSIALGAVEFLQKPLSEDKLRNIWQHVVHKAFNAGETVLSKPLKPIKEASLTAESENQNRSIAENAAQNKKGEHGESPASDKFPVPLTPQLEQGERLLGDGDCQDQLYCSIEDAGENDRESTGLRDSGFSESKFVENTCNNAIGPVNLLENSPPRKPGDAVMEDEVDSTEDSKTDECNATKKGLVGSRRVLRESPASRSNRKKMKVDWTLALHKRFVQAVEQLGIDQAIPSRVLELMQVEGLTRHNVASHLQKYRMHRRPIMPKQDNVEWGFANKPAIAVPSFHSSYGLSGTQLHPVWGHPCQLPSTGQMWDHTNFPTWQHPENCVWSTYPRMHADAWGYPVVPPQETCTIYPQALSGYQGSDVVEDCNKVYTNSFDLHPGEDVIDKLVNEAISKPWLPLPLGLNPPSTESVLKELHKHGIPKIPPHSHS